MESIHESNLVALYTKDGPITYRDLLKDKSNLSKTFFSKNDVECIRHIFQKILLNESFYPVSTRELSCPEIDLPEKGVFIKTSGTTSYGKLAHLDIESLVYSALNPMKDLEIGEGDLLLLSLPIYHVSGLSILIRSIMNKASLILPGSPMEHLATHISFVPTQLKRFMKTKNPYKNLKAILVGGAIIPDAICKKALEKNLPIFITYGMTEMASQIATAKYSASNGVSFGKPLKGREIKIIDNEIYVRGQTLFKGYLNKPSPFIDGWFPTKDLGFLDKHGLKITGRKDRMIISGGEKIHPEEIETLLQSHPLVDHAKIQARSDLEFGQRPKLMIQTLLTKHEIRNYLIERIEKFKVPNLEDIFLNPSDFIFTK
jgi:O-succinylbenzoic acid--CoA ligase